MKRYENEEQIKDDIFDIFCKCRNEISSDRRQTYFLQLWELIFRWCENFFMRKYFIEDLRVKPDKRQYKQNDFGIKIYNITMRIIKENSKNNIPKEKSEFFAYLNTCIHRESDMFLKKDGSENISDTIHIPKGQMQKVKEIKYILRAKENKLCRELTSEEEKQSINEWYNDDKAYQEYIEVKNVMNVISIYQKTGDEEINLLDTVVAMPYMENTANSSLNEKITKLKEKYKEAAEYVLSKKYKKTQQFYKELFTLYCIQEFEDYSFLTPLLDEQIIQEYQNGENNLNYKDITRRYYNYNEDSLSSKASNMLNDELLNKIRAYLKENQ